jgi:hypothetical protein
VIKVTILTHSQYSKAVARCQRYPAKKTGKNPALPAVKGNSLLVFVIRPIIVMADSICHTADGISDDASFSSVHIGSFIVCC